MFMGRSPATPSRSCLPKADPCALCFLFPSKVEVWGEEWETFTFLAVTPQRKPFVCSSSFTPPPPPPPARQEPDCPSQRRVSCLSLNSCQTWQSDFSPTASSLLLRRGCAEWFYVNLTQARLWGRRNTQLRKWLWKIFFSFFYIIN